MAQTGDVVGGKYRLHRQLGEGGMGAVFEAENLNTGRRVAIKVLHGEWVSRAEVTRRFMHEARVTTAIAHPNIVEILDLDTDAEQGVLFIVQELLAGETLEAYLASLPERRVSLPTAIELLLPVMSALVAAHARGIVHRDIKPANIFLLRGRRGELVPKVIDFGIAKDVAAAEPSPHNTQAGVALGTPSYMSPEQVAGLADIDAQSDVWSLGVLFYEMLAGRLPYEAPNANLIMGKILYESPTPLECYCPELDPAVLEIVNSCLQRDRSQRFRSVRVMLSAMLELEGFPPTLRVPLLQETAAPEPSSSNLPKSSRGGVLTAPEVAAGTIEPLSRTVPTEPPRPRGVVLRGVGAAALALVLTLTIVSVGWWWMREAPPTGPTVAAPTPVFFAPTNQTDGAVRPPSASASATARAAAAVEAPLALPVAPPIAMPSERETVRRASPSSPRALPRLVQFPAPAATAPRAVAPRGGALPAPTPHRTTTQTPRLRADEL